MSTSIVVTHRRKHKRNYRSVLSFLKEHTSSLDIGIKGLRKDGTFGPKHLNCNEQVVQHFARLRNGQESYLPHQLNSTKLTYHSYGEHTYYYTGAGEDKKQYTMPMVDVDCKTRGTAADARAVLDYLSSDACREKYGFSLPGLYKEVSTHGNGGHGFPILDKCGLDAATINGLLYRLAKVTHTKNGAIATGLLNRIVREEGFNVDFVEIKGTCPVVEWGEAKYEVLSYKSGTLAKLPREATARFQELKNTTVVSANDLFRLPVSWQEKPVAPTSGTGSISGKFFDEQRLAGVGEGGYYRVLAERLGCCDLETSDRHKATTEDAAIFMMLLEHCTNNMNSNGTLPTGRVRKLWMSLKKAHDIERPWSPGRYTAIRNHLSRLGLLDWEDNEYVPPTYDHSGNKKNGVAAKWRLSAELMQMIEDVRDEVLGRGVVAANKQGTQRYPQYTQEGIQALLASDTETIVPVPRDVIPLYRYSPDEITSYITPFATLAA